MHNSLGWCHGCKSQARIEILPTAEDEKDLEQALQLLRAELADLSSAPLPGGRWWQLETKALAERRDRLSFLETRIAEQKQQLADQRLLRKILSIREGTGRCLRCQSDDIQLFPAGNILYGDSDTVRVRHEHPGCTGTLVTVDSDMSFYLKRMPEKLYDIECRWLSKAELLERGVS